MIARRVYGNLSGFRQNFYGSIHAHYHRLTGRTRNTGLLDTEMRGLAADLRRDGLIKVSDWLDPQTVERVRAHVLKAAEAHGNRRSDYITVLEAQALAENAPEVFDLFEPRIRAFIEAYFGSAFMVNSAAFRLTRHVPDEVRSKGEVYSDHWHTDSGPTSLLAMFVLLSDLTSEGGPTSALDIGATKSVVRRGYASRQKRGPLLDEIEAHPSRVEMTGPAGTIMFVNVARCLHRAGIPKQGLSREWLQFRLFPTKGVTDTTRLQPARILEYTNRIPQKG